MRDPDEGEARLPARPAADPEEGEASLAPTGPGVIRVLLADDQALVRAGFRVLLESAADIEVAGEAANGEEAVSLAGENIPAGGGSR